MVERNRIAMVHRVVDQSLVRMNQIERDADGVFRVVQYVHALRDGESPRELPHSGTVHRACDTLAEARQGLLEITAKLQSQFQYVPMDGYDELALDVPAPFELGRAELPWSTEGPEERWAW